MLLQFLEYKSFKDLSRMVKSVQFSEIYKQNKTGKRLILFDTKKFTEKCSEIIISNTQFKWKANIWPS